MSRSYVLRHRINSLSNPVLEAGTKFFSLSGKKANLLYSPVLNAESDTYTFTGQDTSFFYATDTDSRAGDEAALEALYTATNGDSWDNNTGWSASGMSLSDSIYGVQVETVDAQLRVRSVKLNGSTGFITQYEVGSDGILGGNNLTGSLPPELENLKQCYYFNVKNNAIGGELPSEMGNMTNMRRLLLQGRLFDPDPTGDDHHPGKEANDGNRTNRFTGVFPSWLGNLSNLVALELQGVNNNVTSLTGNIPTEIGNLSNLQGLWVDFNNLTGGIPSELSGLSSLIQLSMDYNQLDGEVDPSINTTWTNMKFLRLAENEFTGDFPELTNLTQLKRLIIRSNNFTGNLDWVETVQWDDLFTIMVGFNNFTGTPPGITPSMEGMIVYETIGNNFSGDLPDNINNLNRVIILTVGFEEGLTGTLPQTGWSGFSNSLRNMRMNNTAITGNIPAGFISNADNPDLQNLYFNNSDFTSMDVSAVDTLQNGEVSAGGNRLTPKDLCLTDGSIPSRLSVGTQNAFDTADTISAGTIIDFSQYDHPNNSYSWYRDGNQISGETSFTYDTTGESSGVVITMQIDHPSFTQTFESNGKTIA